VFGFFLLRLSGQGALTMLSRNMIMKWFIAKRGMAGGISSVFVALGFSVAPLFFDHLIESTSWRGSWIIIALVAGFGFSFFIFLFFRDNPEDCGLLPDGSQKQGAPRKKIIVKAIRQFTMKEARKTYSYWIFTLSLALAALIVTGFVFNVVSIFSEAGMDKTTALSVFIPSSFVSVVVTLIGGYFSDFIKLKKLLIIMVLGEALFVFSLPFLSIPFFYFLLIIGNGVLNGMYAVLISVLWPRFFGRQHLGEISGSSLSVIVFFSAIGPLLFSTSFSHFGSYSEAAWICFAICMVILVAAFKANNPQEKLV
jgi:sugar phosphate permease